MKSTEVADRYAGALYELGQENEILSQLGEDLDYVHQALNEVQVLQEFYEHPIIPDEDKQRILAEIFSGQVDDRVLHFLQLLVDNKREEYFDLIRRRYQEIWSDRENVLNVTIYTARKPRDGELQNKVRRRLQEVTGKTVRITNLEVDSSLIGGIKLRFGDKVIDGSLNSRLRGLGEFVQQGGKDG